MPRSAVSLDELQAAAGDPAAGRGQFRAALRRSGDLLTPQVEAILDVWYGSSVPTLICWLHSQAMTANPTRRIWLPYGVGSGAGFSTPHGPSSTRPGLTTSRRSAYATPAAARTALTPSRLPTISLRYVLALLIPITATLKPFLADGGATPDEVETMYQAWVKAVLLQVILWSQPYVRDGDF